MVTSAGVRTVIMMNRNTSAEPKKSIAAGALQDRAQVDDDEYKEEIKCKRGAPPIYGYYRYWEVARVLCRAGPASSASGTGPSRV